MPVSAPNPIAYEPLNYMPDAPPSAAWRSRASAVFYGVAGISAAVATTYFGTQYYVATTTQVLAQQLPNLSKAAQITINILGVPGTCIRYLSQMISLVKDLRKTLEKSERAHTSFIQKLCRLFLLLGIGVAAGTGAYNLTAIQEQEYDIVYNPAWLSIALPAFLGAMEGAESMLGSLGVKNMVSLFKYLITGKNEDEKFHENFSALIATRTVSAAGIFLILFSFSTIVDELKRNILMTDEDSMTAGNVAIFILSTLGMFPQALLDVEKMSELLQKMHNKELSVFQSLLAVPLSTASSSLNFIVGYEFLEPIEMTHATRSSFGAMAALPKTITAFVFLEKALREAATVAGEKLNEIKGCIGKYRAAPPASKTSYGSFLP